MLTKETVPHVGVSFYPVSVRVCLISVACLARPATTLSFRFHFIYLCCFCCILELCDSVLSVSEVSSFFVCFTFIASTIFLRNLSIFIDV